MPALPTAPQDFSLVLEDLIARPMIFPGEDPLMYENLRAALLQDLSPRSPYEATLAVNLVTLEWEAFRHRRMRDDLIRAHARDLALGALSTGRIQGVIRSREEDVVLASDLVGANRKKQTAAIRALQVRGISPGEVVAKAYAQVSQQVEMHEKRLAEFETRRRRLKEEYDRLRAARAKPVEDAEIVG